jgi:hypothetical protein
MTVTPGAILRIPIQLDVVEHRPGSLGFGVTEQRDLRHVGALTGSIPSSPATRNPSEEDGAPPSRLTLLRAIIETYLTIVISGQSIEERAVLVMWGATFPSGSEVPR